MCISSFAADLMGSSVVTRACSCGSLSRGKTAEVTSHTFYPTRNAFSRNDSELVVNYTAKKSYCRRAIELTCECSSHPSATR